jgi:hypothetical protein
MLGPLRYGGVISNGAFIRQKIIVEFTLIHRTNKLIPLKQLTNRQTAIHKLIQFMHKEGMGYRKISDFLNRSGIKTHTKKPGLTLKFTVTLKECKKEKKELRSEIKPTQC